MPQPKIGVSLRAETTRRKELRVGLGAGKGKGKGKVGVGKKGG